MKYLILRFAFVLFLTVQSSQGFASTAWQRVAKGLSYTKLTTIQNNSPITLHAFKIDPTKYNIKPIVPKKPSAAKIMAIESDALLAINANFFDVDYNILGLVIRDKTLIHKHKPITWWSSLCVRDQKLSISSSKDLGVNTCHNAIQAGPRLVIDGHIPKLKESFTAKTAVGINRNGELIIAVTRQPLAISKLAEIFLGKEENNGLDCTNALNLDGGSSSQLYARIGDFELDLPTIIKVPVGLGVFEK